MKTKEEFFNEMFPDRNQMDTIYHPALSSKDIFNMGVDFAETWISVKEELPEIGETVLLKTVSKHNNVEYKEYAVGFLEEYEDEIDEISRLEWRFELGDPIELYCYDFWRPINRR